MLPPHMFKFSELYPKYGLGAVKNLWLLMSLIPIAQTVKGLLKKGGIGIGVPWAAYDFGDCMNWW
mgnify:FL=1